MSRPGWLTYIRDTVVFVAGLMIIFKQAGLFFAAPPQGPSIELLAIAALCCNVPGILQVIQWRSATPSSPSSAQQEPAVSPSEQASPAPSAGEA